MIVDLLILTIIGCVLEALATMMSGMVFSGAPSFTFSLLIIFICVTRWNLWGLIPIPILAAATWIGGGFNALENLAATYDWRLYISILFGMITIAVNVIFFKKVGTKKFLNSNTKMVLLILLDYILYSIVQFIVYRLICSGGLLHSGEIVVQYHTYEEGVQILKDTNICIYGENGFIYNIFGLAVTYIGAFVLRSQGVICNVVEKLVCDKKEAEANRLDEERFKTVQEDDASEKEVGTSQLDEEKYSTNLDEETSKKELEQDSSEKKY